ncbi:MAG: hypothetical protein HQL21_04190 [Candidatus Omnitrophica bacterium]|nr:hypothetical protein [Candidatus Omnitrophota bacterium]
MMNTDGLIQRIEDRFPGFGLNKRQEIHRLVVEIQRRDRTGVEEVFSDIPLGLPFSTVKALLLKRRYPELTGRGIKIQETFSAFDVDPAHRVPLESPRPFSPKKIYVERGEENCDLVKRIAKMFPQAGLDVIDSFKFFTANKRLSIPDYNRRCDQVFVVRERHDFFKACPCSPGVVGCGYHNANLGFGCPYECSYCFLQNYTNTPGIIFPSNLDDFFDAFTRYKRSVRVGSGEMTDSLVFDHITEFSPRIVEAFQAHPESIFEFKTKSAQVDLLLDVPSAWNIVVAWSVNPSQIVSEEEHGTATLEERLEAAARCASHGYRTAFHFDPIMYYDGWAGDYAFVVERIFEEVPKESIAWISLGTLRMTKEQKKMIENRFPDTTILNTELLTRADGKIRYHETVRRDIYSTMGSLIRERSRKTPLYLCMETADMWRSLGMTWTWN